MRTALVGLRRTIGILGLATLGKDAINAADGMTLLQSKLRLVTRDEAELGRVQQQIVGLARETRSDLIATGDLYARIARSSKQLRASQSDILRVTKAVTQAIQISGNTSVEASAGMIQLAQALASGTLRGDELRSVLEQMPRVAQAIADGLGVTVGELRKLGSEGKLTSEQVLKALISQASKLNAEFAKMAPTIGQSMTVLFNELKVAVAELFKATGVTSGLTESINGLASAIRTITGFIEDMRTALDPVIEKMAEMERRFPRIAKALEFAAKSTLSSPLSGLLGLFGGGGPKARPGGHSATEGLAGIAGDQLEEINVTVRKIVDKNGDALRELEEETRTSTERISAEYARLQAALQTLLDEKKITPTQFNERIDEFIKDNIEIDINAIRRLYKDVQVQTSQLGEFMEGVWQGVGRSIQATLSDAIYEWRLSWRSLLDIARRALADITSAIITSGIKKALVGQTTASGATTGGILAGLGKLFGLAGGGRFDGARIVGEDGPELVTGRGRVFNQRQMAFAGMSGAQITYAPQITFRVETKDEDGMRREVAEFVETRLAQDRAEFTRQLQRSGVEVKG